MPRQCAGQQRVLVPRAQWHGRPKYLNKASLSLGDHSLYRGIRRQVREPEPEAPFLAELNHEGRGVTILGSTADVHPPRTARSPSTASINRSTGSSSAGCRFIRGIVPLRQSLAMAHCPAARFGPNASAGASAEEPQRTLPGGAAVAGGEWRNSGPGTFAGAADNSGAWAEIVLWSGALRCVADQRVAASSRRRLRRSSTVISTLSSGIWRGVPGQEARGRFGVRDVRGRV